MKKRRKKVKKTSMEFFLRERAKEETKMFSNTS